MALPQNFVSVTRRPPDVEDYIDMLRRYRSWIIGPMFAGLVISTVVAFLWKDTFQSTAVMRITPQQVSEKLVPAEFSTQMTQRLNSMEQDILSRTTLEGLITSPALNLYQRERTDRPMEDIVQDMRNHDIHIQPIQMSQSAGGAPDGRTMSTAFSITFTYPDRYKAQAVVQQLVTRFTEQNVQVQRTQAHMTSDFLDDELKTSKEALNKIDDQITKFKIENQGKLPEEFNSNTAMLNNAQLSLSSLGSELQREMDLKSTYETNLQSATSQLTYYQDNADDFVAGGSAQMSVQNQQLVTVSNQLTNEEQTLAGLQKSLGAKNYQVTTLKSEIEVLREKKAQLEKEQAQKDANVQQPDAPKKVPNKSAQNAILNTKAQIESYKTQIAEASDNIKRIQGLQENMKKNIAMYEQRIQAAPLNERQWAALQQEHALDQEAYDATVKKRQLAETSANLEEHKAGENLEVLDPASDPQQPIEPKRPQWAAVGTGLGLLLGVVLAGGKEMKNTSLKNLKDVRAYTNLPVLSSIPLLENALLVRRKRRLFWLAWTSAFIFGTMAVLASMYYYYFGQR
jgi:succinoglycan biosynthesis transport protein ExoP